MAKSTRIQHVVLLMLENRSFDHVFGYRPGVGGLKGDEFNLLKPLAPSSESNPPYRVSNGAPYAVLAGEGPGHSFPDANEQLSGNKAGPSASAPATNIGFVSNYQSELVLGDKVKNATPADIRVVMESFAPTMLPSINALADAFCVCDHWYSEVPGPTQPNRLYMHAATSFGYVHNVWSQVFEGRTIYNNLQDAGCTWATYDFDQNEVLNFKQVSSETANFKLFEKDFAADVKSGKLPNYSFIVPRFLNSDSAGQLAARAAGRALRRQPHRRRVRRASGQHRRLDEERADCDLRRTWRLLRPRRAAVEGHSQSGWDRLAAARRHRVLGAEVRLRSSRHARAGGDRVAVGGEGLSVDSTVYQHTSALATLKNLYALPKFLTARDAPAQPVRRPVPEGVQGANRHTRDAAARTAADDRGPEERSVSPGQPAARRNAEGNRPWRARVDRPFASRWPGARHHAEDTGSGIRPHSQAIPEALRAQVTARQAWPASFDTIRKFCIMPVSSCGRMWQWYTVLPIHCLKCMRTLTTLLAGTQMVSRNVPGG